MKLENAVAHFETMGLVLEKSHSDGTWELRRGDAVVSLGSGPIQSALSHWETQQYELMITKAFLDSLIARSSQWNRTEVEAVIDWLGRAEAPYAPALIQLRGKTYWPNDTWRIEAAQIMGRHGIYLPDARTGIRLEAASILQARLSGEASNDGQQEGNRMEPTQNVASEKTPVH